MNRPRFTRCIQLTISLAVVLAQGISSNAQSTAKGTCTLRTAPVSAGDTFYANGQYDKAVDSYIQERKVGGVEGDRLHNAQIRALLDENKLDAAEAEIKTWQSAAPTNAWAKTSLGELQLRKGLIQESGATLQSAFAADGCNPQVRADLAKIYALTAMFATAKRFLDSAHYLDSVDDTITRSWINSEPQQVQKQELNKYLETAAKYLSEDAKAKVIQQQKRLTVAQESPCQLVTPVSSVKIPYLQIQDGPHDRIFWAFEVNINGKTVSLEEDSSISGILLKKSTAEKLHLQPVDGLEVTGIGSRADVTATVAKADKILINNLGYQNCAVLVTKTNLRIDGETAEQKNSNVYLEFPADGMIGPDASRDFLVTLDKPGREFRLDPIPSSNGVPSAPMHLVTGVAPEAEPLHDRTIDPSMKDWSKAFRKDQFFVFPAHLNSVPVHSTAPITAWYSMDTNSRLNTISFEEAKKVSGFGSGVELPSLTGVMNHFYPTGPIAIDFFGFHPEAQPMSAEDMSIRSHEDGFPLTGMLGADMLAMFAIHLDYRDDLLKMDYDPKKVSHCPPHMNLPSCF